MLTRKIVQELKLIGGGALNTPNIEKDSSLDLIFKGTFLAIKRSTKLANLPKKIDTEETLNEVKALLEKVGSTLRENYFTVMVLTEKDKEYKFLATSEVVDSAVVDFKVTCTQTRDTSKGVQYASFKFEEQV